MKENIFSLLTIIFLIGCSKPEIEVNTSKILSIYPNPAIHVGIIAVDYPQVSSLKVFDPSGKTVLNESVNPGRQEYQLQLTDRGIYHVVLEAGPSIVITKKFIKP